MKTVVALILILAVATFIVVGGNKCFDIEKWLADTEDLNDDFNLIEKLRDAWNAVQDDPEAPEWFKPVRYIRVTFETIGNWFAWIVNFTDLLTPWNYVKSLDQYNIWGVSQ